MSSATKGEGKGAKRRQAGNRRAQHNAVYLNPDMREQMIAESAYYRAQARGFNGGDEMRDWLAAEDEINRLLLNQA